jgi:hypothetical protein
MTYDNLIKACKETLLEIKDDEVIASGMGTMKLRREGSFIYPKFALFLELIRTEPLLHEYIKKVHLKRILKEDDK